MYCLNKFGLETFTPSYFKVVLRYVKEKCKFSSDGYKRSYKLQALNIGH